ncbi:putative ankyrin repeat protein RBE_0319 [Hydractinia symbiolongicarpus]|uniref:putative ankyrin repeat protein RBE_0319 n=1 Tax=Hydractinia symbiolongicarpus TaxID=13093 RepID=UPI00254BA7B4|nr:putative ankyrin repeat protein RBE_0319 [Hydractinia symbiolongicarpus]XP_057310366.1 putative ankyrin repeat protein RBE_0319 [Hydractinia symbiolongicarpus]XP_057310375.1 putative ankyrin repeat protein RBE_0319 [Hydractinia symbiolongicarpus]
MEDGSAELPCPVRCTKTTTITHEQTASSLMTVFTLTGILDKVSPRENVKSLCQQSKECNQIISYSCTTCSLKICEKCQNLHSCSNKSYINVIFNQKLKELQPLCKQHDSLARFVCIDCENLLTCAYCTHRQHKNHRIKTIDDFGLEAKKWFRSFITSFDETKVVLEKLTRKYSDALTNLEKERELFVQKLKERKLKRLEEYLKILNKEEEDLLRIFDEKSKEFKAKLTCDGFVDNKKVQEFANYIQTLNLKSHFELVTEKLEIERQLRRLSLFPRTIPTFNSHLHQMNKADISSNPLGEMKISIDEITTAGVDPNECSVYRNLIDEDETQPNYSQLTTDLMNLVKTLKKYEKPIVNPSSGKQQQNDVKPKSFQHVKKSYSFEELEKIIENGDVKTFHTILIDHPSIVKMRGFYERTLLMEAAWYNKPSIVKCLIDAGSDVNAVNANKWNAYHYSACCGHHDVLKVLINHDVTNINNLNSYNYTPLHLASYFGHIDCVKLLLSIPHIDVNVRDSYNDTPLHLASENDHIECVKLLLSIPHIDINIRDN